LANRASNPFGAVCVVCRICSTAGLPPLAPHAAQLDTHLWVTISLSMGEAARYGYSFHLGPYDASLPLVLDPAVLVYAGYIGGSSVDYGTGIAVDGAGNAYVTGDTISDQTTFPVTVGPDLSYNGSDGCCNYGDAFVAKVNAAGTALVYVGYIGGAGRDRAL